MKFICYFRNSFRVLHLEKVTLDITVCTWKSVFELFKTKLPILETISVCWIDERKDGKGGRKRVVFPSLSKNLSTSSLSSGGFTITQEQRCGEKRVFGASYSGPNMGEALDILIESIEFYTFPF